MEPVGTIQRKHRKTLVKLNEREREKERVYKKEKTNNPLPIQNSCALLVKARFQCAVWDAGGQASFKNKNYYPPQLR